MTGRRPGEVRLLYFANQAEEARDVARLCQHLIRSEGVASEQILVLVRGDRNGAVSSLLAEQMNRLADVSAAEASGTDPLDTNGGRIALSLLRLSANEADDLAWRSLMELTRGVGPACTAAITDLARSEGIRFSQALQQVARNPASVDRLGNRIADAARQWQDKVIAVRQAAPALERQLHQAVVQASDVREEQESLLAYCTSIAEQTGAGTVPDLVRALGTSLDQGEQILVEGCINVLTMHKAKGLTAEVVIVVGVEDELIPGRNGGPREGDERRLLYVSMTRAKHRLYMTYCQRRTGAQRYVGRDAGRLNRTLTRFLADAPLNAESGTQFVMALINN